MLAPVRAPPFCTPDIIERRRYGTIRDTSRAREIKVARSRGDVSQTFDTSIGPLPGSELHELYILLMDLYVVKFQVYWHLYGPDQSDVTLSENYLICDM